MISDDWYGQNYCCQDEFQGKPSRLESIPASSALAQDPPWDGHLAHPLASPLTGKRMLRNIEKGKTFSDPGASSLGINAVFRN